MALTKNDIVTSVHELGFTKKKSVEIIETLLEIMKSTLEKDEDVLISGFGKFCVKQKKQRKIKGQDKRPMSLRSDYRTIKSLYLSDVLSHKN